MIDGTKKEELTLSLSDLMAILWKRLWIVLLAAILVGGACFAYNYATYTEEYTSTSKLYVLNSEVMEGASASTTAYYFQLALTVVEDCKELILSETVLTNVAQELALDISPLALRDMIEIENAVESRILAVSVTTGNPELSCDIVNAVSEQGVQRVREIMNVNQMSIYESGKVSTNPSNHVGWQLPVLFGILAALVVYGICLLIMLSDDKVTVAEDVEVYLGLTVLGDIPHMSDNSSKKRGGRYYGKYYGKYVGKN